MQVHTGERGVTDESGNSDHIPHDHAKVSATNVQPGSPWIAEFSRLITLESSTEARNWTIGSFAYF